MPVIHEAAGGRVRKQIDCAACGSSRTRLDKAALAQDEAVIVCSACGVSRTYRPMSSGRLIEVPDN